jgi:chemotaxis protein methyltransferase CheR
MTWSQPAFGEVARLVGSRTGLVFPPTRHESVELGIRQAMARVGVADPDHYRELLAADASALDDLVVELTVGETYFFREPGQFEFIRREILPELRRAGRGIRAWSAGCASGEEAYSLAILLADAGLAERSHVLATDISRAALAKARRAVYGEWSLRGEGAVVARRHLTPEGSRYRLGDAIRRRVAFEHLNLTLDTYPSFVTGTWGMDLILCRNVLIYLDPAAVGHVARRLFEALADGGWLITASSDPPLAELAPLETVLAAEGVFYRRRRKGSAPGIEPGQPSAQAEVAPPLLTPGWEGAVPAPEKPAARLAPPSPLPLSRTPDILAEAQDALVRGDYERVVRLTRDRGPDAAATVLHVRALANLDSEAAQRACAGGAAQHPLVPEIHYLHAVLLLDFGRTDEALRAVRRVLYLDRNLAVAHLTLGAILRQRGDRAGARRAYRNALELCKACPPEQPLPLADGELAGRLAEAAKVQLALLDSAASTP